MKVYLSWSYADAVSRAYMYQQWRSQLSKRSVGHTAARCTINLKELACSYFMRAVQDQDRRRSMSEAFFQLWTEFSIMMMMNFIDKLEVLVTICCIYECYLSVCLYSQNTIAQALNLFLDRRPMWGALYMSYFKLIKKILISINDKCIIQTLKDVLYKLSITLCLNFVTDILACNS